MSVRHARSSVRVYVCSHDTTVGRLDLSPHVIHCVTDKHIRTEGTVTIGLVPPPRELGDGSWLNLIRPNDVLNLYLNDGTSGYVRQLVGYVDSVRDSVEVLESGATRVRTTIEGTDFTKALSRTSIYFNSYVADALAPQLQARVAGSDPMIDNLAGAELYRQGLRWFGTPADIIESHLLVLLGFQGQWRLPASYPDLPPGRNGNVFTGGEDRREDRAHLQLVLRNRVSGVTGSRYRRVAKAGILRHVDLDGPPELHALAGLLQHPLRNGAPLLGADETGKASGSVQFLADRTTTGNRDGVHLGVDIEARSRPHAANDTTVYPVFHGTIEDIRYDAKSGNLISLRHEIAGARPFVLTSQYLHLRSPDRRDEVFRERPPSPCERARLDEDRPFLAEDRRLLLHRRFDCPNNPRAAEPAADPAHVLQVGCRVFPNDPIGIAGATGTGQIRSGGACEPGSPHLHFQLHYRQLVRDENGEIGPVDFYVDPQRFVPIPGISTAPLAIDKGGTFDAARRAASDRLLDQVIAYRRGRREFRTLLDVLDRSYIEREHIDGFLASEQMLSESGNLLALLEAQSNECMNELCFDLRLAGRAAGTPPLEEDEFSGNRDESGRLAPHYVPAVILREYPFTTMNRCTYPRAAPRVIEDPSRVSEDPLPMGEVYGLPEAPGVFFSSREYPVLTRPCRPILTSTPTHERQPADVGLDPSDEDVAARRALHAANQARAAAALVREHPRDSEADFLVAADQAATAVRSAATAAEDSAADVERLRSGSDDTPSARSVAELAAKAAREAERQLAHLAAGTTPDPPEPPPDDALVVGDPVDVALVASDDPVELLARMAEIAALATEDAARILLTVVETARAARNARAALRPDEAERARADRPPSVRYIDTATLHASDILRMTVGRSDLALFNVFDLRSSDLQADLAFVNRGIVPILSYESFARHGLRVREIFSTYTQLGADEGPDRSLRKTIARWALLNDHWFQHESQYLAGTIECLPLLHCRVGYRLDIPARDECYYVEGVRHEWSIDAEGRTSLRTTLTVTRGQPMIRRPGEAILHVAVPGFDESDVVSADSRGIVLAGPRRHPFADVALAASRAKPPPAPTSARERLLRVVLGSRYVPVLPWARGLHVGRRPGRG